jgi:hypothetical protein
MWPLEKRKESRTRNPKNNMEIVKPTYDFQIVSAYEPRRK